MTPRPSHAFRDFFCNVIARRPYSILESTRREGPFVVAFVPTEERSTPGWIDQQLHRASGGTLYLYDPADLSHEAQERLCAHLSECDDVRVIAATRYVPADFVLGSDPVWSPLRELVGEVVVELPPLRSRTEDVVPLFLQLAAEAAALHGPSPVETCTEAAQRRLVEYAWPGNLLELRVAAVRAASVATGGIVALGDLPLDGDVTFPGCGDTYARIDLGAR